MGLGRHGKRKLHDHYIDGDKVVASRRGENTPLVSIPAIGHYPRGAPIGQDGYCYMVEGNFDHQFIPYISRTTGKSNGGCDTCGWDEAIHADITHVTCDRCGAVVAKKTKVSIECDEDYGYSEHTFDDKKIQLRNLLRQMRYFCSTGCKTRWFAEHEGVIE